MDPAPAQLERDDASATLAHRHFDGHGPAIPVDLARWANLSVTDTMRAITEARPSLTTITIAGTDYLLGPTTQDELAGCREEAKGVVVLLGFDELLFGYRDRTPTLPGDRNATVFPHRKRHAALHRPARLTSSGNVEGPHTPDRGHATRAGLRRCHAPCQTKSSRHLMTDTTVP